MKNLMVLSWALLARKKKKKGWEPCFSHIIVGAKTPIRRKSRLGLISYGVHGQQGMRDGAPPGRRMVSVSLYCLWALV